MASFDSDYESFKTKIDEATPAGKVTSPPTYTKDPNQPKLYHVNMSHHNKGYRAISTNPDVTADVTDDSAVLITEKNDDILVIRERQSFVKHTALACFVFWACCWPLGLTAFILVVVADNKSKVPLPGYASAARRLGVHSLRTSIAGIVLGVIVLVLYLVFLYKFIPVMLQAMAKMNSRALQISGNGVPGKVPGAGYDSQQAGYYSG